MSQEMTRQQLAEQMADEHARSEGNNGNAEISFLEGWYVADSRPHEREQALIKSVTRMRCDCKFKYRNGTQYTAYECDRCCAKFAYEAALSSHKEQT